MECFDCNGNLSPATLRKKLTGKSYIVMLKRFYCKHRYLTLALALSPILGFGILVFHYKLIECLIS